MTIVHLSGNVDRRTVPAARRDLLGRLRDGAGALHIDLGDVAWIDSAGLATLVEVTRQAHTQGLQVHLHRVGEDVMKKMRLAHLDTVLSISSRIGEPTLH